MISIGNAVRSHVAQEHMKNEIASFGLPRCDALGLDSLPRGKTLIRLTSRPYSPYVAEKWSLFY
jgi:hypothetical protein